MITEPKEGAEKKLKKAHLLTYLAIFFLYAGLIISGGFLLSTNWVAWTFLFISINLTAFLFIKSQSYLTEYINVKLKENEKK